LAPRSQTLYEERWSMSEVQPDQPQDEAIESETAVEETPAEPSAEVEGTEDEGADVAADEGEEPEAE
jgi:hypothetical protein